MDCTPIFGTLTVTGLSKAMSLVNKVTCDSDAIFEDVLQLKNRRPILPYRIAYEVLEDKDTPAVNVYVAKSILSAASCALLACEMLEDVIVEVQLETVILASTV